MSDDCANEWGCRLCIPAERAARSRQQLSARENDSFGHLRDEVNATFDNGEFQLLKVATCGSDAQLFALIQATGGDLNSCIIACGSYVSGENGGLQNWSTSNFAIQHGPSTITHPKFVSTQFTKRNTVPLPYMIPGTMSEKALAAYEEKCLTEIHVRCLFARLSGSPYKNLLMEIMLAGCGATLSAAALTKIGYLAAHHGISITLDEIMTGGGREPC